MITPWQEREFEKKENFSLLRFEMTVDLHTVIVIGEDLAQWFPLTPWIPLASSPATFCLSSPDCLPYGRLLSSSQRQKSRLSAGPLVAQALA